MWNRFAGIIGLIALGFGLISAWVFKRFDDFYTLSHLVLGVILAVYWFFSVGTRRASEATQIVRGRTVRYGVSALVYSLLFLGIVGSLNWLVNRNNKRFDLTEEGVYSLSQQSAQLMERLTQPLKIAIFDVQAENQQGQDPKDLMALYKDKNPGKVSTEFVNPRAKPQLVEQYGMKGDNIVYLEYGTGEGKAVSRLNQPTEEAITNAVLKLTIGSAKKIYYLQGHGEPGLEDAGQRGYKAFADAVKDEHFTMESIVLSQKQKVPEDAAAVVFAGQMTPLLPGEKEALIQYIEGGGRAILMVDPRESTDARAIAEHFGITVDNDVVIDLVQRLLMGPTLATEFITNNFTAHDITKGLGKQDVVVYNMASSVRPTGKPDPLVTYTELVKTSDNGWGEINLKGIFESDEPNAQLDPDDIKGPVSIAVSYEKKLESGDKAAADQSVQKVSRLVVFGDSDWITNKYLQYSSHKDLILNTLNWTSGQEASISIRPKKMRASLAPITGETFRSMLLSGFIVPELVLLIGLMIWWRRRTLAV